MTFCPSPSSICTPSMAGPPSTTREMVRVPFKAPIQTDLNPPCQAYRDPPFLTHCSLHRISLYRGGHHHRDYFRHLLDQRHNLPSFHPAILEARGRFACRSLHHVCHQANRDMLGSVTPSCRGLEGRSQCH